MTDRLTDDEIKALHQFCTAQLPKRTPWVCLDASKMVRLLDEIEERRRVERAKAIEEATGCEPCMEAGRYVEAHAETADGVFVCKECFDACGTVIDEAEEPMTAEQWSKFQALMPKRKDGGA